MVRSISLLLVSLVYVVFASAVYVNGQPKGIRGRDGGGLALGRSSSEFNKLSGDSISDLEMFPLVGQPEASISDVEEHSYLGSEEGVVSSRNLQPTVLPPIHKKETFPALPFLFSIDTWTPDLSVWTWRNMKKLPSVKYYLDKFFMQESLLFHPLEYFERLPRPTTHPQTKTASLKHVKVINHKGFGKESNRYVMSLVVFKGKVYASTLNFKSREGLDFFFLGLPFISDGAEIWEGTKRVVDRGKSAVWNWTNVVKGGLTKPQNGGVRNMVVVGDHLYAVTVNHVTGFELWRTKDGHHWTTEVTLGLGNIMNISGRGLGVFRGYLYVGVENRVTEAQLWRRKVTWDGSWKDGHVWEVLDHGQGKGGILSNFWYSDFCEFNGYLYVGTMNFYGLEIWRVVDDNPEDDEVVFERVFKGSLNDHGVGVSKLIVWNDQLIAGTMFREPDGAVMLSSSDGSNFKVHYPPRKTTEEGEQNQYIYLWDMEIYGNRLYVSAVEWPSAKKGFVLFSLEDDLDNWKVETSTAFGYAPLYYGVRSMTVYDDELLLGTASTEPTVIFSAEQRRCRA